MTGTNRNLALELDETRKKIETLDEEYDRGVEELFTRWGNVLADIDCSGFPDWKYANIADIEFEHYGVSPFARKNYYSACSWLRQTKSVLAYDNECTASIVNRKVGDVVKLAAKGWFGDELDSASSEFPVKWLDWTATEIEAELARKKAAADKEADEAAAKIEEISKARADASERALYEKLKAKYGDAD